MKNKKYQWLTIITISLIVATINIFHVIIGLAKTPDGFTYLATGHYYLDYFEYLQHIASGLSGRWLPLNYFSTDDFGVDSRFFPYIILGKIAWIFRLSPVTVYWMAVFFLTIFTLIGFYFIIDLILKKQAFHLKIIAFFIVIFSGPFYKIITDRGRFVLNPYDFWYGPSVFIRRFELIPYHALGVVLLLLIIIIINKIWGRLASLSTRTVFVIGIGVAGLMDIMMTFSPIALISFVPALLVVSAIDFIREKNNRFKIFLLNLIILVLIIPVGLYLRNTPGYGGIGFEMNWIERVPFWFLLLNLGPIVLFFPFGLADYLKINSFLSRTLLIFTLIGYLLFFSPATTFLGIHNLRFFSPVSYIFFGILTVFALKKTGKLFVLLSLLLIVYSWILNFDSLKLRLLGLDPRTPETALTYVPNSLIAGLKSLRNHPAGNVLTNPYGGIGILVPIFSYRRIYTGPEGATRDLQKKQALADLFYQGKMTDRQAKKFLKTNSLGFVILTSFDNYDARNMNRYRFLKPIYNKESIIIWEII